MVTARHGDQLMRAKRALDCGYCTISILKETVVAALKGTVIVDSDSDSWKAGGELMASSKIGDQV